MPPTPPSPLEFAERLRDASPRWVYDIAGSEVASIFTPLLSRCSPFMAPMEVVTIYHLAHASQWVNHTELVAILHNGVVRADLQVALVEFPLIFTTYLAGEECRPSVSGGSPAPKSPLAPGDGGSRPRHQSDRAGRGLFTLRVRCFPARCRQNP